MMDSRTYQKEIKRTLSPESFSSPSQMLLMLALGLGGESGEVQDIIKKHIFHKHLLNEQHLIEELGDVLWYLANICNYFNINLEDVMQENINKLLERYPDGFSYEDSINRSR